MKTQYIRIAVFILILGGSAFAAPEVETGIRYYRDARFQEAREIFQKCIETCEQAREKEPAYAYLALIAFAYRDEDKMHTHLSSLYKRNPEYDISALESVPPDIEEYIAKIRPKPPSSSTLNISTTPGGARIFCRLLPPGAEESNQFVLQKGMDKGLTPLTLETEPGNYELIIEKQGYHALSVELELSPGVSPPLHMEMAEINPG